LSGICLGERAQIAKICAKLIYFIDRVMGRCLISKISCYVGTHMVYC
jgi:hypothetical protein